ncbi:MAG: T9SS type A sorting domain-containing protein, partial [Candidatus Bipolaricaulaceae bacterium]
REAADEDEDSAPIWWYEDDDSDVMTPQGAVSTAPSLGDTSITGITETVKIFMFNAQRGHWERIDLRETAVGSGIFRSTTCVLVSDSRHPGDGNLGSRAGDTIMAFYQDPSNHSDIAIISIKVSEGGAGAVTPPTVALSVAFDRTTYYPGDTVTITVTDEQYAGAAEIVGTNVLVLLDKDGGVITSWNRLEALAGQPGKFRVTYTLPETVKLGTITAKYTDPYMPTRTVQATAQVVAKALTNVTGITISPNPFKTTTTFTIQAEPAGAVAQKITITIYDLTGAKVAVVEGTNTASVSWNGGNLRNGAYIYVAVVEGAGKAWTFKGFVYIER